METQSIGMRIKNRRSELGLKQLLIKELTGISSGNLSDIENGKKLPSTPALITLSDVLDCSIDWILKGVDSLRCENVILSDEREDHLISGFRELSEEDQEELLDILDLKLRKVKRDAQKMVKSSNSEGEDLGDKVG